MSDLTDVIPFAVIGASVLGSAHCVGMCGGLALSQSKTVAHQLLYHGGRLAGYLALGTAGGALGSRLFDASVAAWMTWVASVGMAALFGILAVRAWKGRVPHLSWFPRRWLEGAYGRGGPFGMGLLTAALPCGWLQSFVLAAVATRSAAGGAVLLLCFWLGTLPALVALPILSRGPLRPFLTRHPRISAVLLLAAAIGSFGNRIYHAPFRFGDPHQTTELTSCH